MPLTFTIHTRIDDRAATTPSVERAQSSGMGGRSPVRRFHQVQDQEEALRQECDQDPGADCRAGARTSVATISSKETDIGILPRRLGEFLVPSFPLVDIPCPHLQRVDVEEQSFPCRKGLGLPRPSLPFSARHRKCG